MKLKFAFALSREGLFEKAHFGDADKFVFFEVENGHFSEVGEKENPFKGMHGHHHGQGHEHGHGHSGKAHKITEFLRKEGVHAVVAHQFGRNIRRLSEHLIPIIITQETIEGAQGILQPQLETIIAEWEAEPEQHKILKARG